ncbi:3-oxo-tetronate kinase [uncultured Enterovirga sp.]|uniref:3-oxo-tetronate kinase n=1 Tax=uncultured Enterovirga sp. TaxID=2026352 RepID=UPI0035CA6798
MTTGPVLGCIADDLTGATDLGLTLSRGGLRVVQVTGVPEAGDLPGDADVIVVALKSRTVPAAEAVEMSLRAADMLLGAGARQLFFKYCSTFDSTDAGNIGPVAEALLGRLGAAIAVATPAFPTNGRTVFQGHLFVGRQLLSDSPMRDHPLTPMRDPNLVAVLGRQTRLPVGLIAFDAVERGREAIGEALARLAADGTRLAIVDALTDRHLVELGAAVAEAPLVTGGSGLAIGLPDAYRARGWVGPRAEARAAAIPPGRSAILAGSCSTATQKQVAAAERAGLATFRISPAEIAAGRQDAAQVLAWAGEQNSDRPVLVYSTAPPDDVTGAQASLGRERAAALVEETFAEIARGLVGRQGVTRLVVAGGETSGAVVTALGVKALEIGPEIDPGVPWTFSLSDPRMALALKSGNFGTDDFFLKAWDALP